MGIINRKDSTLVEPRDGVGRTGLRSGVRGRLAFWPLILLFQEGQSSLFFFESGQFRATLLALTVVLMPLNNLNRP